MKPPPFTYRAPNSLDEALALKAEFAGDSAVLAGGQSLIPLLNFRLARPSVVIDLRSVPGLASIGARANQLAVGAMVRQRDVELSDVALKACPLVPEALAYVGHVTVRNRGTVGGSVAHADAAAELPTALLALDGEVEARGPAGSRSIAAEDLFAFHFTTTLEPDELITEVRFTALKPRSGWAFVEFARRHGDFALAGVCAVVRLSARGEAEHVRLSLGGVSSTPRRALDSERIMLGSRLEDAAIASAAAEAEKLVDTGVAEAGQLRHRRRVVGALTRRALRRARERAEATPG